MSRKVKSAITAEEERIQDDESLISLLLRLKRRREKQAHPSGPGADGASDAERVNRVQHGQERTTIPASITLLPILMLLTELPPPAIAPPPTWNRICSSEGHRKPYSPKRSQTYADGVGREEDDGPGARLDARVLQTVVLRRHRQHVSR